MPKPPNVIQIVADDMAIGDLSLFNEHGPMTPSLDHLAQVGVVGTQQYSSSPVCMPARATLMTGRYPHAVGTVDFRHHRPFNFLLPATQTVADVFRREGYATGIVGKWHLGSGPLHPSRRGFQESVTFQGGLMDYWDWVLDYRGLTKKFADGRYITDVFTDESLQFIERHRNEPFFLHLAYTAPHTPLQAPEADIEMFRGRDLGANLEVLYAMNWRMDIGIGQLLQALDDWGLSEHTVVMFTSDNGPVQNSSTGRDNLGLRDGKYSVHEGGIRVPIIWRYPAGLPSATSLNAASHFSDVAPTLFELAGIPRPYQFLLDGQSLAPALTGESVLAPYTRYWHWSRGGLTPELNVAIREGSWKLMRGIGEAASQLSPPDATFGDVGSPNTDLPVNGQWRQSHLEAFVRLHNAGPELDRAGVRVPSSFESAEEYFEALHHLFIGGKGPAAPMASAPPELYDLSIDPLERNDLATTEPDITARLERRLDEWLEQACNFVRTLESADPYDHARYLGGQAIT